MVLHGGGQSFFLLWPGRRILCLSLIIIMAKVQITVNENEAHPLLHPPLKRGATRWRGYSNPPPLTFETVPPPRNLHKLIHRVAPSISNRHRYRNMGPRKLHVPRGGAPYWFNDIKVKLNVKDGIRTVELTRYHMKPYPLTRESSGMIYTGGEYRRKPEDSTARSVPAPSPKTVLVALHELTQEMQRMTLGKTGSDVKLPTVNEIEYEAS